MSGNDGKTTTTGDPLAQEFIRQFSEMNASNMAVARALEKFAKSMETIEETMSDLVAELAVWGVAFEALGDRIDAGHEITPEDLVLAYAEASKQGEGENEEEEEEDE